MSVKSRQGLQREFHFGKNDENSYHFEKKSFRQKKIGGDFFSLFGSRKPQLKLL